MNQLMGEYKDMEDYKAVQGVFTQVWNLYKKFGCGILTDVQWQEFVNIGMDTSREYKQVDRRLERLYRGMFGALQEYYESTAKEYQMPE